MASVLFSVGYGIKWGVTQRCRGGPLSEPRRQKLGLDGLPLVRDHEAARSDGGAHYRSPLRAGGLQSQDARPALSIVGSLAVPVAKAVCDAPTMPRSHDPRHRSTQKNTQKNNAVQAVPLFPKEGWASAPEIARLEAPPAGCCLWWNAANLVGAVNWR